MGPKKVLGMLERKEELMMTTNSLSLKSHVLTEKGLGLPVGRSPKPRFLLAVLGLLGLLQFAQNVIDASFNIFRYIGQINRGSSRLSPKNFWDISLHVGLIGLQIMLSKNATHLKPKCDKSVW